MNLNKNVQIIYEEDGLGNVCESNLIDYMKQGVWALYGINRETNEYKCLNVGKSNNVGKELLYDIACLHFIKERKDGEIEYINQFKEYCGFKYKRNQVQEYLYPHIDSQWKSLKIFYIHDVSDADIEREYAHENSAIYWRNGRPFEKV